MLPRVTTEARSEQFMVVHSDARDPSAFEIERALVESAGARLELTRSSGEAELIENLRVADAILVSSAEITRTVVESMPRCRLIVRYGVGLDTLDIPAATEHGIVVAHFPDFCQPEVANHAIMLLLACARKLVSLDRAVRDGRWRPGPLAPMGAIHAETLGLLAFGNIAQEVAPRAQALGLRVIAFDPYIGGEPFQRLGVERVASQDELLRRSDYVSLHPPLTPETRHLLGAEQFRQMKRSASLINTSRGPVVDEAALAEALREGTIAGAGLDVFEHEPLPADSPLVDMENVVLTPHSASYSDPAVEKLKHRVGQTAVELMEGRWPDASAVVANPEVRPRAALQRHP